MIVIAGAFPARGDAIVKTIDRKFPVGKFCPLESRTAAGADLSFVATATSMRITFSANNFKGGNFNDLHLDDISVQLKTVFDANTLVVSGYGDCYDTTAPPGQPSGGMLLAPAYNFLGPSTPEISLDTFATNVGSWTGSHLAFDSSRTAPTTPAAAPAGQVTLPDGSLALGASGDGAVVVSAGKTITGLTVGQTYVVFGWWRIQETDRLTISISNPCLDPDGDGYTVCDGSCDIVPGQLCGDCNINNPHCNVFCTDADADGWCVGNDCNDAVATCNANCATDADADATPDCRDSCIDADHDGYGTAGGAGNTCLGADCNGANHYCNASCTDADGDGRCAGVDCNDANSGVGNDLPEINDWVDQQCPGDLGYGVFDETSGTTGFASNANKNLYSWPAQSGATQYILVRSPSKTFPAGCTTSTVSTTSATISGNPAAGSAFFYLTRPTLPKRGSYGQNSSGVERAAICGQETNCGNAVDDDADGSTDCADSDCLNTAPCHVYNFFMLDTAGDDITDTSLFTFFQGAVVGASDYIFFQIVESGSRTIAWCSTNALFYKTNYMNLAPTLGSATSGAWNKWRKAPITGNAWQGPDTTGHVNDFGDNCLGSYGWCSEQFPTEPKCSILPNRTNDCESYDLTSGFCGALPAWQLTIKIAPTRLLACGF